MPQASLKIDILLPHLFFARLFFMKIQHGCLDSTLCLEHMFNFGPWDFISLHSRTTYAVHMRLFYGIIDYL